MRLLLSVYWPYSHKDADVTLEVKDLAARKGSGEEGRGNWSQLCHGTLSGALATIHAVRRGTNRG